jgi:hypothetical protein
MRVAWNLTLNAAQDYNILEPLVCGVWLSPVRNIGYIPSVPNIIKYKYI